MSTEEKKTEKKNEKSEQKKVAQEESKDLPKKAPEPRGGIDDLKRMVAMIERAVETNQSRLIGRALRHNGPLRQLVTKEVLTEAVTLYVPEGVARMQLLGQIELLPPTPVTNPSSSAEMDTTAEESVPEAKEDPVAPRTTIVPEVETYISLLVLTTLLRQGSSLAEQTLAAAQQLVLSCGQHNRRSLDSLRAKAFSYLGLAHERALETQTASAAASAGSLRPMFLAAHRTACLQHDEIGQATLLNLLLRSLLEENQIEQAFKLVSKTNFPEKASNNQFCRYLYYTGRISALQLEYGDAYEKLKSSLRKVPQNPGVAGFRRCVTKLMVIVGLLMGEVPERGIFNQPDYRVALAPYLALTVAVREGNLAEFNRVVAAHKPVFIADKMYTLVVRLSHSVIKTGLRRISLSYSRISMDDICLKLTLESAVSAESVCAKAIRDGVIDATIDHENGWLTSNERSNVYATTEPQRAFHQRVEFCLAVRNEAVKAMRYPDDAFKPHKAKPKDDKSPEEIAKEIEEELDEEGGL